MIRKRILLQRILNNYSKKKLDIIILLLICFFYITIIKTNIQILNSGKNLQIQANKLIEENFFIIDSYNLNDVKSHLYGFTVSKDGILTDNYYKNLGEYQDPEPQGVFVMIRKTKNKIIINQDFYGSYGLYIYENKNTNYFALSNSFFYLEEYLVGKQNISFNKDYADNLILTPLWSFSLDQTLINEIYQIASNTFVIIDIKKKVFKIYYIDYKENTIQLESEEGLKIIDKWVDKWGYILRSLKEQTNFMSFELSGGFDTRILLSLLLNSGINSSDLNIISSKSKSMRIDLNIATNISRKFGFKINNFIFDENGTIFSSKDSLFNSVYSKLGFHKDFILNFKFYEKPRFIFSGSNGESLRGSPGFPINEYISQIFWRRFLGHEKEFYNSSIRLINRSISLLKQKKTFNNDFEISYDIYSKSCGKNHFGKYALERFLGNIFYIQPLMDPDIKRIKYNINNKNPHDLIAYIYIRFAHDLINFPFQGGRKLDFRSIQKAEKLNKNNLPYTIKSDYNKNFYIDHKRKCPIIQSKKKTKNPKEYLIFLFKSSRFNSILDKIYDKNVYGYQNENKSNIFYYKDHMALLAIALTLENLSLNERFAKNLSAINRYNISKILKDFFNENYF